jgi:hypothetical protein
MVSERVFGGIIIINYYLLMSIIMGMCLALTCDSCRFNCILHYVTYRVFCVFPLQLHTKLVWHIVTSFYVLYMFCFYVIKYLMTKNIPILYSTE